MKAIKLSMVDAFGRVVTQSVMGFSVGAWAAHRMPHGNGEPDPSPSGGWRVSHVPTGMAIRSLVDDLSKNDAIRIAGALNDRIPEAREWTGRPPVVSDYACVVEAVVAEMLSEGQP